MTRQGAHRTRPCTHCFKPYRVALVGHGTDAKPLITEPAEPHDEQKWTAQYELLKGPTPGNWPKPRPTH